jgi:PAS domain S-box-containing protein
MDPPAQSLHEFSSQEEARRDKPTVQDRFEAIYPHGRLLRTDVWPLARAARGGSHSFTHIHFHNKPTGKSWADAYNVSPIRDRGGETKLLVVAIRDTNVYELEHWMIHQDGQVAALRENAHAIFDSKGHVTRVIGMSADVAARVQAEAALHESEDRFRNMADAAPFMIWVAGPDKRCTFFNKRWLEFSGRTMEQELSSGWAAGVYPEDLDRCLAIYTSSFDAQRSFQTEHRLRRADGEYRWLLNSGVPRIEPSGAFAGYIGSCIDITDLKRMQDEALNRQKLECVGLLAGGIAHDFNNLLGSILADAEIALVDLPQDAPVVEEIQNIKNLAIRASEIVRELMIYAGQETAHLEPVDISNLVEEMLQLLKVSISKNAVLKTDLWTGLPTVQANAAQIRQVVMNLITNASESIGEAPGEIHVNTALVSLPDGKYLELVVSDTGCGMATETQAKIFDPFFTTKLAGRGLGLAVVQGIVRNHGGIIHLRSVPGRGTKFQILLPCSSVPNANSGDSTVADLVFRAPVD